MAAFLESIIDWEKIIERKPTSRFRIIASFMLTLAPTVYVLMVNFIGEISQEVLAIGQNFGFKGGFLYLSWPLSLEYLIIFVFFGIAVVVAYKKEG
jgi:hypothetical protein